MTARYGYLALGRVKFLVYKSPEGETLPPSIYNSEDQLHGWWAEKVRASAQASYNQAIASWNKAWQEFRSQCFVETKRVKQDTGSVFKTWIEVDVVTLPDGTIEQFDRGKGGEQISRQFRSATPPPAALDDPSSSFTQWRNRITRSEVRTWRADLYVDGTATPLDIDTSQGWKYGLPIEEILRILNDLADKGWTVLHVSEDRGLYTGEDAQNDAYVTRARYMLVN